MPEPEVARTSPSAAVPRPAEWADLLRLALHLGSCVLRLVTARGARRLTVVEPGGELSGPRTPRT